MEEGNADDTGNEEVFPPPPPDYSSLEKEGDIRVSVIKPFKPSPRVSRIVPQGKCYYHPTKPASFICASCSKSVCTACAVNLSGVYFCPQCAPYQSFAPPPAPAPSQPDYSGLYRAMLMIGIILALIGAILSVAYWPLSSMSAARFENLLEEYQTEGGHNFQDYRPGDVITIRDTIVRLEIDYDVSYGVVTRIWFDSTGKGDNDFIMTFDADLERDYHVGDEVAITLHVEENERTHDEVLRELDNNLPNMSNIDQTSSINIVFYGILAFGALLVLFYVFFTAKAKQSKEAEERGPSEVGAENEAGNYEGWSR